MNPKGPKYQYREYLPKPEGKLLLQKPYFVPYKYFGPFGEVVGLLCAVDERGNSVPHNLKRQNAGAACDSCQTRVKS